MNRPPFLVQRIRSAKVMVRYSAAAAICGLALGCADVTRAGPPPVVAAPRSVTPSRLVPVGPTDFSGVAGTSVPRGPVIRVLGDNEVPAVGVEVAFTGERSKVVVTDASGIAEFGPLQLDSVAGNQFIDAQGRVAPDKALAFLFDVHSVVGPLVSLIPAAGNNQRGEPRTALVNQ